MKHFVYYPQIEYSGHTMTNIMVRAKIRDAVKNQSYVYYTYTINDADRADILATKYYGNPSYTWAIFYANDIMDPLSEWPLTQNQFYEFIKKKYGSIELANLRNHHYLLENQYIIDETTFLDTNVPANMKKAVSNYEYEEEVNNAKRNIKIIDSVYIRQLTNELNNIFK